MADLLGMFCNGVMIEKPRALPPVLLGIFAVSALLTVVFCLKTVAFLSVCFSFFS